MKIVKLMLNCPGFIVNLHIFLKMLIEGTGI